MADKSGWLINACSNNVHCTNTVIHTFFLQQFMLECTNIMKPRYDLTTLEPQPQKFVPHDIVEVSASANAPKNNKWMVRCASDSRYSVLNMANILIRFVFDSLNLLVNQSS